MLNNIDVLNNFQNLKVIDATNCYIEEVNLNLPKLEDLNLSNNFLKAYPVLANMSKLKTLNLNSNKLADLKSMKVEFTQALVSINIGNNPTLQFSSTRDFMDFLKKISNLRMKSLDIDLDCVKEFDGISIFLK